MVNKIDGVSGHQPEISRTSNDSKPQADDAASRKSSGTSNADQVNLTSSAQLLKDLNDSIDASSATDQQRIDAIKQALADGLYEVNAGRIADKLLRLDEQL